MSEKLTDAQKRQAEIVAEQEDAQSARPTPSQNENDAARLGLGEAVVAADSVKVERDAEAEKPAAGYKTRDSKAA